MCEHLDRSCDPAPRRQILRVWIRSGRPSESDCWAAADTGRHLYSPDPASETWDLAIAHLREQARREELLTPWKIRKFNFISSSCQMWKQLRSWRLRLFNGQLVSQKYHFEVQTPPALLMPPLQWWLENHTNSKSINEILIEFRPPTVQILFSRAGHWMKSKNYNLPLTSATRHATDQI